MNSETTPTASYKTGGVSRRPPYTCYPTRMTVPLTGTDSNLTPLSQALRKAGYRGVRQGKSILA